MSNAWRLLTSAFSWPVLQAKLEKGNTSLEKAEKGPLSHGVGLSRQAMYGFFSMSQYETYRSNAAEAPIMRRWVFGALVVSLLIHGVFFYYAYRKRLEGFKMPTEERLAPPRVFQMKQVAIPKVEELTEKVTTLPDKAPAAPVKPVEIPMEKPQVEEVHIAPQIPEISKQLLADKPKVEPSGFDQLMKAEAGTRSALDKELSAANNSFLKEGPRSAHQPIIEMPSGGKAGAGNGEGNVSIPGMKSLDETLAQTGPLHQGDKAGMPGGALFEYDSYELRQDALEQMKKLGMLFERYPGAIFYIDGHTDSFGPPEYNQKLSEMRAESVKQWLVQSMHIAPDRIQTRGFGNTKWLVSPEKSKEEQAPNRRVEIVVKTNRK